MLGPISFAGLTLIGYKQTANIDIYIDTLQNNISHYVEKKRFELCQNVVHLIKSIKF